ncbi:glycosyl hydrolase family 95 catalytic domain-containing protein [Streptomyces tauricus]|uniref:glycosyl hydrolase family 95 catalytic domain-containing protein n=1 Tax=Streptomyces tauricus TaxID=68274 RepID=UPI00224347F9|nr:glycoside hydrolase N-terminal domain-containing protein [Streptomyces tauricus]MCW8102598.1 glycoside hydrolase family 95 protein [Streptomyces tauricus]
MSTGTENASSPSGTWEPAPAARWEDAFLSGNGRHGTLVFGDPNDDRVIVTHHTLVRPNGGEHARPPELAAELPALQDRLLAGDLTAAEEFTDGRPLQWVQPFHPAFQVRLRRPSDGERDYRRTVDFTTGVAEAHCAGWRSRVFVSRADDVIVQYVTSPGPALDITLDHRLPGAPDGLGVSDGAVLTSEGAVLTLSARYPGSDRAYTGVTLAVVTGGRTTLTAPGLRVADAESVLLLTRVERHGGELDTVARAQALRALLPDSGDPYRGDPYGGLLERHLRLHRTAFARVSLTLEADDTERALPGSELIERPGSPALLERLFAAGRYHLLSASGMLPPRLTGLWTGDWDTAWSGAFTTDANLNLQTASAVAGALPEVVDAHAALVHGQLPHWRENARAVFGARGVVAPPHTDGESGHTYHFSREYPLHLWTAGADWLLKPLVDHDETRGERDPRLAVALAEVALFYEDFLTRTDEHGHLVVVPSYSPENRPANADASWGAVNAAMDLSAARHALLTAAAYHPGPEADRWRALAERLPHHRVNDDGALAEWAWPGLDDTYDHRHLSHLYGVWPLDEINPYDTPALAAAAHRALELRGAENDSSHGHLHHALVAARLRDAERVAHALGQVLAGDFFHASLMSAHYPHRDVYNADAAHTLPALVIETLIQSTPDRLVLLPALPAAFPAGALRGVRTRFGAEVDLDWSPREVRAVLRPTRTHRIDLRTPSGARQLDLRAGEDRVLTLGPRRTYSAADPHIPPPMEGTPWQHAHGT